MRRNRRLGFGLDAVLDAGGPVVCEVATNVLHGLSRLALGRPSITPALVERLYDEPRGLFVDEVRPRGTRPGIETWTALAPLALPDLPEEIGRRLVEEHLLDQRRFWLPVPPPSVAADEPTFSMSDRRLGLRRYWRGPTWINAAFLLWARAATPGLRRARSRARRAAGRGRDALGAARVYDATTGRGMGAHDFSFSTLILELADPDPRALASFLR